MSNIKHPRCLIRDMAIDAKKRLCDAETSYYNVALEPPKSLSPTQKLVYLKLREFYEKGEEVFNPIEQLADKELMAFLPHDGKERYILQLCNEYVSMKELLESKLASSNADKKN